MQRYREKIEGLIRSCLPIPHKLYDVTKRLKTKEEVEEYFPGFIAFIDCSEQQIPRPKNKKNRKLYYSGKKKKHTVKNLYTVNQKGLILYKSPNTSKEVENMTTTSTKIIALNYPMMY